MSKPIHATTKTFDREVIQADRPVLVDYYADWCAPCRLLAPILDQLAIELDGKVKIVKINVEQEYPLALRYGIQGVPTLMLFRGGRPVDTIVGLLPPHTLKSRLEEMAQQTQPAMG